MNVSLLIYYSLLYNFMFIKIHHQTGNLFILIISTLIWLFDLFGFFTRKSNNFSVMTNLIYTMVCFYCV